MDELQAGSVVQLSPEAGDGQFAGCFMVVTEPKAWGAQGYVQIPGQGQAYYRAKHDEMEVIGLAAFVIREEEK